MYRFVIRKSKNGQWYWVFVAPNNKDMCCSETMHNKEDVRTAIDTIKEQAEFAIVEEE